MPSHQQLNSHQQRVDPISSQPAYVLSSSQPICQLFLDTFKFGILSYCFSILSIILHSKSNSIHFMKQNPESEHPSIQQSPQSIANNQTLRSFGVILLLFEITIIIIYGIFVRMDTQLAADTLQSQRYAAFQDVNVMMLIGFGFLMTFIRTHSWSAIVYTFFINAIVVQIYILFNGFWERVLHGFAHEGTFIYLQQIILTKSSYAVAAVLISYGAVLGRIGPRELLVMSVVQTIGYALNQVIVYEYVNSFDGGSTTIHSYGAYFGLTVSLFLSTKVEPISKPEANYVSNLFAMIGTLFLWLFWPSFNFGVTAQTFFEQNQIVANTLLSLTGSCLSTFILTSLLSRGIEMEDILNATLAGGVAIGAPCGLLYYPGIAMAIGFTSGIISTLGFKYLTPKLQRKLGLYDSCGVHNLHGIPGVFGGVMSAIIVAFYQTGYDHSVAANYGSNSIFNKVNGSFLHQGGLQIAGTFVSIGISIFSGIVAGIIVRLMYKEDPHTFYRDTKYFQPASIETSAESHMNEPMKEIAMQKLQRLEETEHRERERFEKEQYLKQSQIVIDQAQSIIKPTLTTLMMSTDHIQSEQNRMVQNTQ